MNLVDDRLIGAVRIIAGLAKGDDTGFTHNKKATISLDFIEEDRESVRDYLDLYRELQQEGPEVDLSKYL